MSGGEDRALGWLQFLNRVFVSALRGRFREQFRAFFPRYNAMRDKRKTSGIYLLIDIVLILSVKEYVNEIYISM